MVNLLLLERTDTLKSQKYKRNVLNLREEKEAQNEIDPK